MLVGQGDQRPPRCPWRRRTDHACAESCFARRLKFELAFHRRSRPVAEIADPPSRMPERIFDLEELEVIIDELPVERPDCPTRTTPSRAVHRLDPFGEVDHRDLGLRKRLVLGAAKAAHRQQAGAIGPEESARLGAEPFIPARSTLDGSEAHHRIEPRNSTVGLHVHHEQSHRFLLKINNFNILPRPGRPRPSGRG